MNQRAVAATTTAHARPLAMKGICPPSDARNPGKAFADRGAGERPATGWINSAYCRDLAAGNDHDWIFYFHRSLSRCTKWNIDNVDPSGLCPNSYELSSKRCPDSQRFNMLSSYQRSCFVAFFFTELDRPIYFEPLGAMKGTFSPNVVPGVYPSGNLQYLTFFSFIYMVKI